MKSLWLSPQTGSGLGNDGVDVADELDDDHQQQREQDVAAVVGEDGRRLRVLVQGPAIDKKTQHQGHEEQPHQDLAWRGK